MSTSQVQHPLETPVTYVKRVGPRRADVFKSLGILTVLDLFHMYPRKYIDRRSIVKIRDLWQYADKGTEVTVVAVVRGKDIVRSNKKRERFILVVGDEESFLDCIWFQRARTMEKLFTKGEVLAISGQVTDFNDTIQMVHPAFDRLSPQKDDDEYNWNEMFNTGRILPIYTETAEMKETGLEGSILRSVILNAFEKFGGYIEEHLPDEILRRRRLVDYQSALQSVHFPQDTEEIQRSRERLKYDELFSLQMLLGYRRRGIQQIPGISYSVKSKLARTLVERLPYTLTAAQKRVVKEIAGDMENPKPMHRLLQGDVGSGKTIVSLLSVLIAVDNGYQAVFMAPTEILAIQHYSNILRMLQPIGIEPVLMIGSQKKTERKILEESVAYGTAKIVLGTHALFQESVSFHNLGLIVIDEQHRFGVMQRLRLYEKAKSSGTGRAPDLLVMTATPIPRTLSLTLYGDLDTSILDESPPGRKPIKTALRSKNERVKVYEFAHHQVKQGRQVYVVYPLIEQSEKIDLKAAKEGYEELQNGIFKNESVALIHGKLTREENEDIMSRFRDGRIDVLVATTIIEVGVDVPNATIMIIEHAERFGLSQLHQLRGRVGRGTDQSYCILVHYLSPYNVRSAAFNKGSFSDKTFEKEDEKQKGMIRLETISSTEDGFKIAEVDLKLRGPGEFFGVKQSGFPELKLASLIEDRELLQHARSDAFAIIENDPHLRNASLQSLRRYFEVYMKPLLDLTRAG